MNLWLHITDIFPAFFLDNNNNIFYFIIIISIKKLNKPIKTYITKAIILVYCKINNIYNTSDLHLNYSAEFYF